MESTARGVAGTVGNAIVAEADRVDPEGARPAQSPAQAVALQTEAVATADSSVPVALPSARLTLPSNLQPDDVSGGMGVVVDLSGTGRMRSQSGRTVIFDGENMMVQMDTGEMENRINGLSQELRGASPSKRREVSRRFNHAIRARERQTEGWSQPAKIAQADRIGKAWGDSLAHDLGVDVPQPNIHEAFVKSDMKMPSGTKINEWFEKLPEKSSVEVKRTEVSDNKLQASLRDQFPAVWERNGGEKVDILFDMIGLGILDGASSQEEALENMSAVITQVEDMNTIELNKEMANTMAQETDEEAQVVDLATDRASQLLETYNSAVKLGGGKTDAGLAEIYRGLTQPYIMDKAVMDKYLDPEDQADIKVLPTQASQVAFNSGIAKLSDGRGFDSEEEKMQFINSVVREQRAGNEKAIQSVESLKGVIPKSLEDEIRMVEERFPPAEAKRFREEAIADYQLRNDDEVGELIEDILSEVSSAPAPNLEPTDIDTPEEQDAFIRDVLGYAQVSIGQNDKLTSRMYGDYLTALKGGDEERVQSIFNDYIMNFTAGLSGVMGDDTSEGMKRVIQKMHTGLKTGSMGQEYPVYNQVMASLKQSFDEHGRRTIATRQIQAQKKTVEMQSRSDQMLVGDLRNLNRGVLPEGSKVGTSDMGEFMPVTMENMSVSHIESMFNGLRAKYSMSSPLAFQSLDQMESQMVKDRVAHELDVSGWADEDEAERMVQGILAVDESGTPKEITKAIQKLGVEKGDAKKLAGDVSSEDKTTEIE